MCGVWALSVGVSSDFWVWRGTDAPGSVPWPPEQVCHSSDDRGTHFGTGHLDLAVRRAGWAWRGAWALSTCNLSLGLLGTAWYRLVLYSRLGPLASRDGHGVVPAAEALILGLRTWASSQGLPPVGLLPSSTTWS